jgi:hypothetical protein
MLKITPEDCSESNSESNKFFLNALYPTFKGEKTADTQKVY